MNLLVIKQWLKPSPAIATDRPSILYMKMAHATATSSHHPPPKTTSPTGMTSFIVNNMPIRFAILALIVMATAVDYVTRVNINVAIVSMVQHNSSFHESAMDVCPSSGDGIPYQQNVSSSTISPLSGVTFSPASNLNINPLPQHPSTPSWGDSSSALTPPTSFALPLVSPALSNRTHGHRKVMTAPQYDWSPTTQGVILGSFWYTYMLMQVPSGRMAEEFGGKWIVAISLIGSGVINLVTPFVTSSVTLLVVTRMFLGFVQGGIFPSCYAMIGQWMPLRERSLGFAFMEIGATIGSVLATTSSGYLSEHGFAGGWPSVFYMSGVLSLVAFMFWYQLVESNPDSFNGISSEELKYIQDESVEQERGRTSPQPATDHPTLPSCIGGRAPSPFRPQVPWRLIITSGPVIALVCSKFSLSWAYFTLLSKLPAYLHDVLHIPPTQNGLLNASLYMTTCISLLTASHVSERIIVNRLLSRTVCRKTFLAIASIGTAVCFSLVPWAGCDTTLVMCLLLAGNFFLGINSGGDVPVPGEITTNFPATIYAIGNMFGCSTGFIAPYVIGLILESKQGNLLFLWNKVFYLSSGIVLVGTVIFILFGSAQQQDWDQLADDEYRLNEYEEGTNTSTRNHQNPVLYNSCD